MKSIWTKTAVTRKAVSRTAIVFILSIGILVPTGQSFAQTCCNLIVDDEITGTDAASLVYMREEEKLARDVYTAMYELWEIPIFANIARAEQNHMDAVKYLLDAYGLEDPAQEFGIFTNPDLQEFFNTLVEQGSESGLQALMVGALIEEVDIQDLEATLADTASANVQLVYQNLLAGSGNHLRAFVRNIESQGTPYAAQYLTQEEVDQILADANANQRGQGHRGNAGYGRQGRGMNAGACNANQFVDANGDGVCDNYGTSNQMGRRNGRGRNSQGMRGGRWNQ